jgi:type VI secretion system protein VasG
MSSELKTLVGKLNPLCRQGLEEAAGLCVSQTNFNVEIEHFLLRILEHNDTDLQRLLRYYEVDDARLARELTQAMDKLKRGNDRTPALSPHIPKLLEEAWVSSSLHMDGFHIRSGSILLTLVDNDFFRGLMLESCPLLQRIPRQNLRQEIKEIIRGSREDGDSPAPTVAPMAATAPARGRNKGETAASPTAKPAAPGAEKTPALDQFTIDLTQQARAGKIDPVTGRDFEIRQVVDILTRRRQNNPILTGEAGVGKTAVVEGLALRVARGDVPPPLKDIAIRALDLGLLQAGAGVRGEFENRLKTVIQEVARSSRPIILFIDEAHTMIGAGGASGQGDAANLLKPALARGELRTIAATTWSEYKKYFEKDPALTRRFQVVQVREPDEKTAIEMLRGAAERMEKHHKVRIFDEAVQDAVRLSHRYITGRQLPDKAVSVLDTACARVALGQNGTPPQVENVVRRIEQLQLEIAVLQRETASGREHADRLRELGKQLKQAQVEKDRVEKHWRKELDLVNQILDQQKQMEGNKPAGKKKGGKSTNRELERLKRKLESVQGDDPMVSLCVDSHVVAAVISGWTGIPVGRMLTDEIRQIMTLQERLRERVVGQDEALAAVSRRVQTSKAAMDDPGKPVGVFLLVGPSGVGKTETAHALADLLYGGDKNLIRVNMSEYQEAHTVSGLKGSPPGYVGYGQGGVLTEAVRRTPYAVVLLDEVEKAHPDVMELFFQVFDKGVMEDAEGLEIDFRNTVILLTSNVGTELTMDLCRNKGRAAVAPETLLERLRPALLKCFPPAFLGRLVVVPYFPLEKGQIEEIVRLKLEKIQNRFQHNHRAQLTLAKNLIAGVAERCTETDSGARNIDNILTQSMLPGLSREVLQKMADGEEFSGVHVSLDAAGDFLFKVQK